MDQLDEKLNLIVNQLNKIDQKIDDLNKRLDNCASSCQKMDDHIVFIEEVYTTVRSPLDYIKSNFNYITGNSDRSLPQIKN